MIINYSLTKTPEESLVNLTKGWLEDVEDSPPLHRGVLYAAQSIAESLMEIGREEGSEKLKRWANLIFSEIESKTAQWRPFEEK